MLIGFDLFPVITLIIKLIKEIRMTRSQKKGKKKKRNCQTRKKAIANMLVKYTLKSIFYIYKSVNVLKHCSYSALVLSTSAL